LSTNKIVYYYLVYLESLKSEVSGKATKPGARSLPWSDFTKVVTEQWEGESYHDWLI